MSITAAAVRAAVSAPIAVAVLGALVASAIPARAESAAVTIGQLEAQGLEVRIDRVGSAPLDQCVVSKVRNPRDRTELVRVNRGGRDRVIPVVVSRSVTVSLDCSNR